jgi:hypothetical protein
MERRRTRTDSLTDGDSGCTTKEAANEKTECEDETVLCCGGTDGFFSDSEMGGKPDNGSSGEDDCRPGSGVGNGQNANHDARKKDDDWDKAYSSPSGDFPPLTRGLLDISNCVTGDIVVVESTFGDGVVKSKCEKDSKEFR